jgi:hypothetical protein
MSLYSSYVLLWWMCSTGSDCKSLDSSCALLGVGCIPLDRSCMLLWIATVVIHWMAL